MTSQPEQFLTYSLKSRLWTESPSAIYSAVVYGSRSRVERESWNRQKRHATPETRRGRWEVEKRSPFPHWPRRNCISCKMPGQGSKGWWDLRGRWWSQAASQPETGRGGDQHTACFAEFQPGEECSSCSIEQQATEC